MGGFFNSLSNIFTGGGDGFLSNLGDLFGSIPTPLASAGIFAASSLASQMFGQDYNQESLDQAQKQFEASLAEKQSEFGANNALAYAELASRERAVGAAAGATVRAAGIQASASKDIAHRHNELGLGELRMGARDKWADRQIESRKGRDALIMQGRTLQAQQARATGNDAQKAFESIMAGVTGALHR